MKKITHTYERLFKSYRANEFLPIYQEGELINRSEFIRYKAKCLLIKRSLV